MLRPLALLIVVLPMVLASAMPAAAAQEVPAAPTGYTVRGTVVNSVTNQPIARALVSFAQDQAVLTDSTGQFSFENIPAGSYPFSVTKPGYQGRGGSMGGMHSVPRFTLQHPEPPLQIQVGPDMPSLALSITPLASIAGHITLSTADPSDDIRLQIFVRSSQNGHAHWVIAGEARTHSDGSFRIANLEPGSYRICTMASLDRPGFALDGQGAVWGYPSLYYPGTTDINGAGILNVGPGQQAEADITLVRQPFFPVVGIVHSSSETPANFDILDSGGRQTGLFARYERRDGTVHAAVPNGTWTIEAHAYGKSPEWGSTTIQVNGAPASFAINLQMVPKIPVIIRRAFSNSATAQPAGAGPGMNIELSNADEMRGGSFGGLGRDDASGGWQLDMSEPGRYWVKAEAWPPAYVSSVTSGGTDLGSNPLVVMPGSPPSAVEVTLRDDGGTITGVVGSRTSGPPNPNAPGESPQVWIYAIPLFSTAAGMRDVMPNSDGQFSFYAMAPGSYRIVACDTPQEIDFHSAEGLASWSGKGQTVSVDAGGTASVQLDVVHITQQAEP